MTQASPSSNNDTLPLTCTPTAKIAMHGLLKHGLLTHNVCIPYCQPGCERSSSPKLANQKRRSQQRAAELDSGTAWASAAAPGLGLSITTREDALVPAFLLIQGLAFHGVSGYKHRSASSERMSSPTYSTRNSSAAMSRAANRPHACTLLRPKRIGAARACAAQPLDPQAPAPRLSRHNQFAYTLLRLTRSTLEHACAPHTRCARCSTIRRWHSHAGESQGTVRGLVRALMEAQVAASRWSPTRCGLVPRLPRAPGAPAAAGRAMAALWMTACAGPGHSEAQNPKFLS